MIYHVVVPGNDFEIANYYPWDNLFFFCKLLFQVVILFCCKLMFWTTFLHVTVNSFFFANYCSRQPFSNYLFRTNVYKFLKFFANVTNCYSWKIFLQLLQTVALGSFFEQFYCWQLFFCNFWQFFCHWRTILQTLTFLKGFLATCYSGSKQLQHRVYLIWGIPKKYNLSPVRLTLHPIVSFSWLYVCF